MNHSSLNHLSEKLVFQLIVLMKANFKRMIPIVITQLAIGNFNAFAQTNVSGGIYSNTTWTKANSPYIVTGQVTLFPDYTLTIEPGVTVKFNDGVGMEIRGTLVAIGTEADSIIFTSTSNSPTQGIWSGILVTGTANPLGVGNQVRMEYCVGKYAHYFVDLDLAYHGPYIFNHCSFYNNYRVNNDGGMPGTYFNYCHFEGNHTALGNAQFSGRVTHSSFIDNILGADQFGQVDSCFFSGNTEVALIPAGSATGNMITNNNIGVIGYFNGSNHTFNNNTITNNNTGLEINSFFNGSHTFLNNEICHNTAYNVKNTGINDAYIPYTCFCLNDSLSVRAAIDDGYNNPAFGIVSFMPFGCNLTNGCTMTGSVNSSSHTCDNQCDGELSVSLIGSASPVSYLWNNGATDSVLTGLCGGNYHVTVMDLNHCFTTSSGSIQNSTLYLSVTTTPDSGNHNGTVAISVWGGVEPFTFLWSNSSTSATLTNLMAGTYYVTVTDSFGCTVVDTAEVILDLGTFNSEVSSRDLAIKLYPNPAFESATLDYSSLNEKVNAISIINILGERLSIYHPLSDKKIQLQTSVLPAGIYIVELETEKGVMQRKMVVR